MATDNDRHSPSILDLEISKEDVDIMIGECEENIRSHQRIIDKHAKDILKEKARIDELLAILSASDFNAALKVPEKFDTLTLYKKHGTVKKEIVVQEKITSISSKQQKREQFLKDIQAKQSAQTIQKPIAKKPGK
jgi:hypothetical protein